MIGDGDAVGVARQVGQHGVRSAERLLGIDHPFGLAQRCQIRLEGLDVIKVGVDAEKLEAAGLVGGAELGQEQSPEQARETPHGEAKLWSARDPS